MICRCGKEFETDIACARHMSTCKIYREFLKKEKVQRVFIQEGSDYVVCKYCGYKAKDLSRHLYSALPPHPSLQEYRATYPDQLLVCSEVEKKRKETCFRVHGDPNYRNSDLQSKSLREAFSDPALKQKIRDTKTMLYGDPNYVNVEKRKQTLIEKYGVENAMQVPEIAKRSTSTRLSLYKDNPIERRPLISKEELERLLIDMTLKEISVKIGVSESAVSYWVKKHSLKIVRKRIPPKVKEYCDPEAVVREYFEFCLRENRIFSFNDYGIHTEIKKGQRLKRLFYRGMKYYSLFSELGHVILFPEKWGEFFTKLSAFS